MGGRGSAGGSVDLGNGGLSVDRKTYNLAKKAYELEQSVTGIHHNESSIKYGIAHQIAAGGAKSVRSEMERRIRMYQERSSAKATSQNARSVNGYGEKTNREITSISYERAKANTSKSLNDWFGRGMNKKKR